MKIERGRVVRMHYTLRDERGATVESSVGHEPLAYLHGYGQIIPGLERALDGSEAGLRTSFTIPPKDAYGEKDPAAVIRAPREDFPDHITLEPGAELQADTPDGPVTFTVVSVDERHAVLDGNHPLAGQTLTFDVEVVDVRAATAEEVAHEHVHGPGGAHGH
ncbi:MAG TPA: peptidylprolyl isomerase [Candidatus Polarisedimenticolaceae bacterium]|nr:peptidylprolyl isomerase [Candidatus Polarisedimenticolaceae bacterium]